MSGSSLARPQGHVRALWGVPAHDVDTERIGGKIGIGSTRSIEGENLLDAKDTYGVSCWNMPTPRSRVFACAVPARGSKTQRTSNDLACCSALRGEQGRIYFWCCFVRTWPQASAHFECI